MSTNLHRLVSPTDLPQWLPRLFETSWMAESHMIRHNQCGNTLSYFSSPQRSGWNSFHLKCQQSLRRDHSESYYMRQIYNFWANCPLMELALHTPPTNFHMACNYCSTLRRCLFCILSWRGARVSGRTVCSEQHSLLPESLRVFCCPHRVSSPRALGGKRALWAR